MALLPRGIAPAPRRASVLGNRVGIIGTSLIQQNDVATAAKISHWNRGPFSWARFFSKGRFVCEIWHDPAVYPGWEPSQVPGATRSFRGMNAGVSGQTDALIQARRAYLADEVRIDIVFIDDGTNDMAPVAKEVIHAQRVKLAQYYLSRGIVVVLLPILSRATTSWAQGGAERPKAAWISQKTREFCDRTEHCYHLDWNIPWVDAASADGAPRAGYSNDGIHFAPPGGVADGEYIANFLQRLLPDPAPRVWSADDKFNATHNPLGNLLSNPFCTGTGGSPGASGVTGPIATGMRVEVSTGAATVACTKETRTDGRGDWQVMTITPGATDSLIYFRTNSADTAHSFPSGTWVQASMECEIGAFNAWQGVSLYMKDNGAGGLIAYDMEPFDDGAGYIKLPTRVMNGMLITPPIQLVNGSASIRWRQEIRVGSVGGGATGTGVIKSSAVELRQVTDPRSVYGYA